MISIILILFLIVFTIMYLYDMSISFNQNQTNNVVSYCPIKSSDDIHSCYNIYYTAYATVYYDYTSNSIDTDPKWFTSYHVSVYNFILASGSCYYKNENCKYKIYKKYLSKNFIVEINSKFIFEIDSLNIDAIMQSQYMDDIVRIASTNAILF